MCDCAAGEFPYIMFISKVFKGKYDRDYGENEPIFELSQYNASKT